MSKERAEYNRGSEHAVTFLTGAEVARLYDDPVLEPTDYWRGSL